ncbi:ArsR/SmtB family transcription factor [Streptomyces zaomyceticus]
MTTATSPRALEHPTRDQIRLEAVLHALSDPVRLLIVRDMARERAELSCSYFDLPVTKSTTTHHFRVLREGGVIRQTYRGTPNQTPGRAHHHQPLSPGPPGPARAGPPPRPPRAHEPGARLS